MRPHSRIYAHLPCGALGVLDDIENPTAYICRYCLCVFGSMGMPKQCKEILEAQEQQPSRGG